MPKPASVHNKLPVKESAKWLTFEYIMQKYGGMALVIIVMMGLAGAFSDGRLSSARISDPTHRLTVEYESHGRIDSDMNIKIETASHGENITLTLGGEWMDANEITSLYPVASRMSSRNGELILEFHPAAVDVRFAVWLGVTPRKIGKHVYVLHSGDASLRFSQLILP